MTILTFIGSIGLLIFALRITSESLQKIAGDRLRHAQGHMEGNLTKAMFAGLGVTAFVQSSLVTTLMAVSFVSSGIITLAQSMAVIMGANIGTTITAWIIALAGFKYDFIVCAFPLIALALPLIRSHKSTSGSWGELLIGSALLLISIQSLQITSASLCLATGVIPLTIGIGGMSLALIAGLLLAALLHTSAIAVVGAMLLCSQGVVSFTLACAVIIGANIGTCIPSLIASRRGNAMARQAALAHLLFNIIGMVWALACLPLTEHILTSVCQAMGVLSVTLPSESAIGLALFHTLFNVITMLLLLPLSKPLVKLVTHIISDKPLPDDTAFSTKHLEANLLPTSGEMALVQVQKETSRYAADVYKMFELVKEMLNEPMGSQRQITLEERVRQMEEASDNAELQIAQFLNHITPQTLSMSGEQLCRGLYKVVDELESIADALYHCSSTLIQKSEQRQRFTPQMNEQLQHMISLIDAALQHMTHVLSLDEVPSNALDRAYNYEDEINNLRNQIRNQMLDAMERKEIEFQQQAYFTTLINECEKIGDHVINVIAAYNI